MGSGSSLATDRWRRRSGFVSSEKLLRVGRTTRLHHNSSWKPMAHRGSASATSISRSRQPFSCPPDRLASQGCLRRHRKRPQTPLVPKLPRRAVEHPPPQGFGALPVEGGAGSLGARGFGLQSGEARPLVEVVDGLARRLGAASQREGYPRGAFASVAGEDDLGSAHDESVLGAQRGLQLLFFGVRK